MRLASPPASQPEEREALSHFPPRSLPHLVAQRDVLLSYAEANPVRHPLARHCWRQRAPETQEQSGAGACRATHTRSMRQTPPPEPCFSACLPTGLPRPTWPPLQVSVLSGICLCYLLMQTFAIPGTLGLSILCGALYGVKWGWLLVAGALPGVGAGEGQRLHAPGCMV